MDDRAYHQRIQRRRLATIGAGVVTLILGVVWIVSFDVPNGDANPNNSLLQQLQNSWNNAKGKLDNENLSTDPLEQSVNTYLQQVEYDKKREQEKREADPELVDLSEEVFPELD